MSTTVPSLGSPPARRIPKVFLLSYPKAGRTWLRALIGRALIEAHGLPEGALLDTPGLTLAAGAPVAVFDHDQSALQTGLRWQDMPTGRDAYRGTRVLLLGRDLRDNLVSAYFQATRRIHVFDGPLGEFIRHDRYGVDKLLTFYSIWARSRHVPDAFEFVRYEDLHRDTAGTLERVLGFMGAPVPAPAIAAAVAYCRFENMRKAEQEDRFGHHALRPGDPADPEAFKVRKGKVGNFVEYLAPEDIAYIDTAIAARGCPFTLPAS